jgi:hypothetical protein
VRDFAGATIFTIGTITIIGMVLFIPVECTAAPLTIGKQLRSGIIGITSTVDVLSIFGKGDNFVLTLPSPTVTTIMDGLHGIILMDHFIGNFVSDVVLGTILTDRRTVCIRASIIHFGDFATIGTGEIITGAGLTDGRTVTILVAGILFDRIPTIVTGDVGFPTIVTNIFTGTVGVGESNVITERFATIGTSDFVFHRSIPLAPGWRWFELTQV